MYENTTTIDEIARALNARKTTTGFIAKCPAHDDHNPSLSLSEDCGKVLLKCHAGCSNDAVINQLKSRGLWPQNKSKNENFIETRYIYNDTEGKPALVVTRKDLPGGSKKIFQSHYENGKLVSGGFRGEICPYLYEKWQDQAKRMLFLVEGEKCVSCLDEAGFLATTTAGGSGGWRLHYAKYFAGRNVVIVPDTDVVGFRYSIAAFKDIKDLAASVKILELPGLSESEDVYDWFQKGHSVEELKGLVANPPEHSALLKEMLAAKTESLGANIIKNVESVNAVHRSDDEEPIISLEKHPFPSPLEPEALRGIIGEFVNAVFPSTESDQSALVFQFLATFGNIVDRKPYIQIGAAKHYPNLFCTLVGDSSVGRKGTSWDLVASVMRNVDEKWWQNCRIFGLGSGEGLIASVQDEEPTEEQEPGRQLKTISVPHLKDKRGIVIEGEFALTLRVFQREGSTLSPTIRNAWDGGDLRVTTKKESLKSTAPHISVIAHITQAELARLFTTTDIFNGVGNRFLWIATKRSKLVPLAGLPDQSEIDRIVEATKQAVAFAQNTGEMVLSEEAKEIYCGIYADLSRERPGLVGVLSARAAPMIQRMAMIYALLDQSHVIEACHLNAAIAAWEYSERSLYYIFGKSTGDRNADKLLSALLEAENGLTQSEIMQNVFGGNMLIAKAAPIFSLLKACDLIESRQEKSESGRRVIRWLAKRTAYEINGISGDTPLKPYTVQQNADEGSHVSA